MRRYLLLLTLLGALVAPASASARVPGRCTVPRLSGVTVKVARHRLAHAHCRLGKIHRPKIASGTLIVASQRPRAARRVKRGTKVSLWLKAKPIKTTTTTTTLAPAVVRAAIDPAYVQDPTNPLKVTWTYSATATSGTLPDGVLSLTVYEHGQIGDTGGCTLNVGGSITGGTCTLILPAYGAYDVVVTYDGSDPTVAPSTSTDTETITDPNGVGSPTWQPTTTALTVGQVVVNVSQGPPPLNQTFTSTNVSLDVTTGDPDPTLSLTITDLTSGATATGTLANWQALTCELVFGGPSSTSTLTGCGVTAMPFAYTDVLQATVTAEADFPYEASTSSTVEIWSGSLPPNALIQ